MQQRSPLTAGCLAQFVLLALVGVASAASHPWDRLEAALELRIAEPAKAEAALQSLVEEYPEFAAAHYDLGCLLLERDPATAARHFRSAASSRDPELGARAEHNLALALFAVGRLESALAAAERALERRPEDQGYQRNRDALRRILIQRRDAARLAAEEAARRLRLTTEQLPPAWVGEAWTAELAAAGGTGEPYRYSLGEDQELPAGLTLDGPSGTFSGTPTAEAVGDHRIDLVVADAEATASGSVRMIVLPEPAILTRQLPEAVLEETYRVPLRAVGFIRPTWTVTGLPAGLRGGGVGEQAVIEGVPSEEGTFAIDLVAADDHHRREATVTLQVSRDAFAPAEDHLPDATVYQPYEHRLTVRGRGTGYRWSGSAANGLSVTAEGLVRGTPQQATPTQVPVSISNSSGEQRDFLLPIRINPLPVIEVEKNLQGQVGQLLDQPIPITGGTRPFKWRLVGSTEALPAGVDLAEDGVLSGVPQEPGTFTLAVAVADRWQATTQAEVTLVIQEVQQSQQGQDSQEQQGQEGQEGEQQGQDGQQQGEQGQQQGQDGQQGDQDGQQEGQEGQDGQQPGQDGQQQGDQQRPSEDEGQEAGDEGREAGEEQSGTTAQEQGETGGDGVDEAERQAADEAVRRFMGVDAAERFLEDLPRGDQERLLRRLLVPGGDAGKKYEGEPW